MDLIKIGGIDRAIRVRYVDVAKLLMRWNIIYGLCKKQFLKENGREFIPDKDSIIIPHHFYFWSIWKCLVKRGFWPFRKPYRSMRQMIKDIDKNELNEMVIFVGQKILDLPIDEKGNVKKK